MLEVPESGNMKGEPSENSRVEEGAESNKRITATEAADIAQRYYSDVTHDYTGVRLEEIELSEDENFWLVTISHSDYGPSGAPLYGEKSYKSFKIDSYSGGVLSMQIRTIPNK